MPSKEIAEKRKEKVKCPCGSVVSRSSLTRHKKSKKHKNWEEGENVIACALHICL